MTKTKAVLLEENAALNKDLSVAREQLIAAACLGGAITAFFLQVLRYL